MAVANVIAIFRLFQGPRIEHGEKLDVFTLNGQSEHWNVHNYTIVKTGKTIWRGSAGLTYLGEESEIANSDFFYYQFVENHPGSGLKTVLTGGESARGGTVNLPLQLERLGSISGPITDAERKLIKPDLNGYSRGERHYEKVELSIKAALERRP